MRLDSILWQQKLPDWSELEWYALFLRHREAHVDLGPAITEAERRRYGQMLMHVVSFQFSKKKWVDSLPHVRLDPRDVAQDLVSHLYRKTPVFMVPNRPELNPPHPKNPPKSCKPGQEWKVMLAQFYCAVRMRCATIVEERKTRAWEVPLTDCAKRNGGDGEAPSVGLKPIEAVARGVQPLVNLEAFLRAAEPRLTNGVYGANASEIQLLYRYLCRRLARDGVSVAWGNLPDQRPAREGRPKPKPRVGLRHRVSPWQHFDLTTGIRDALSRAVENLALAN